MSWNKHAKEILRIYQQKHGYLKKELLPLKVKEHPELYKKPFLDEGSHKELQHIIGVCQWFIVAGGFDLNHAVTSLRIFSATPR